MTKNKCHRKGHAPYLGLYASVISGFVKCVTAVSVVASVGAVQIGRVFLCLYFPIDSYFEVIISSVFVLAEIRPRSTNCRDSASSFTRHVYFFLLYILFISGISMRFFLVGPSWKVPSVL